jgi:hypothetical protein
MNDVSSCISLFVDMYELWHNEEVWLIHSISDWLIDKTVNWIKLSPPLDLHDHTEEIGPKFKPPDDFLCRDVIVVATKS